jgi:hypothetical protein
VGVGGVDVAPERAALDVRAMIAGRLSIAPFQTRRADSYWSSPGTMTAPPNERRRSVTVAIITRPRSSR